MHIITYDFVSDGVDNDGLDCICILHESAVETKTYDFLL